MTTQNDPLQEGRGEAGIARTPLLLVLLLVVVGAAAYVYLFTDIIREKPAAEQQAALEQVKQPMPQKPQDLIQSAATSAKAAGIPGQAPVVSGSPKPPVAGAAQPQQQTAGLPTAPAKAPAAAVAPPKVAVKAETAPKATQVKPVEQKPAIAPPVKKSSPPAKEPVKTTVKKAAVKPAEPKRAPTGNHLLIVGDYPSDALMREARDKVVRAGLKPAVEKGSAHTVPMHRLLVGEYGDREGAVVALQRVKAGGASGFMLREGDQFVVYAGSFHESERAAVEREKLAAKGLVTILRKSSVSVPSLRLTAGRFATQAEAQKAAAKLTKSGLEPRVVILGSK
jgi:hypothetical protein